MNMNIFLIDVFLMLLTRMMLRFVANVVVIVLETIIDISYAAGSSVLMLFLLLLLYVNT